MTMHFANLTVAGAGIYLALGLLFAVPFAARGVNRIDPIANGGTWGFRLMIVPGVVALWPLLLMRWVRAAQPPIERNAHRDAAGKRAAN